MPPGGAPDTARREPGDPADSDEPVEPVEVEVKLAVEQRDAISALLDRPDPARLAGFAAAGEARDEVVLDRYLDTATEDGLLLRAGMRARLRESTRHPGEVVLAVKRRGTVHGAVTTRTELEGPASRSMDPGAWPDSAPRAAIAVVVASHGPLIEVAALRQRRRVLDLVRGEARVELSLDDLEALDGEAVLDRRTELEAELKAGSPDALQSLAAALLALPGTGPALGSKLEFARAAARRAAEASRAEQ